MDQSRQVVRHALNQKVQNRVKTAIAALLLAIVTVTVPAQAADNKACTLLTPAELETVVGKVAAFKGIAATADAQVCTARSAKGTVMLRWAKSKSKQDSAQAATKGVEAARDMGATVDVKTFGPITCSTMIPPPRMTQYGYNTTCSVTKGDMVAAVEIGARLKKDMVPIDKLRPLAEKLATRF